jgi:cobalt-zinc-cadmium efflux system protein
MLEIPSVIAVHDLRVRTFTSGVDSRTGHIVVREMKGAAAVLKRCQGHPGRNVQD